MLKSPTTLGKSGRAFWNAARDEYGIDDPAGLALLTTASACLDRIDEAQKAIKKHGALVLDRYSAPKINPACQLERDARAGFLAALKALNLDLDPLNAAPGRPAGSLSKGR